MNRRSHYLYEINHVITVKINEINYVITVKINEINAKLLVVLSQGFVSSYSFVTPVGELT
jgi:hypothetical protein